MLDLTAQRGLSKCKKIRERSYRVALSVLPSFLMVWWIDGKEETDDEWMSSDVKDTKEPCTRFRFAIANDYHRSQGNTRNDADLLDSGSVV